MCSNCQQKQGCLGLDKHILFCSDLGRSRRSRSFSRNLLQEHITKIDEQISKNAGKQCSVALLLVKREPLN